MPKLACEAESMMLLSHFSEAGITAWNKRTFLLLHWPGNKSSGGNFLGTAPPLAYPGTEATFPYKIRGQGAPSCLVLPEGIGYLCVLGLGLYVIMLGLCVVGLYMPGMGLYELQGQQRKASTPQLQQSHCSCRPCTMDKAGWWAV